jgi:hypothetical protein
MTTAMKKGRINFNNGDSVIRAAREMGTKHSLVVYCRKDVPEGYSKYVIAFAEHEERDRERDVTLKTATIIHRT